MAQAHAQGSRKVVYAGIVGNLLVAATKFTAAGFTHSSAMLSEAVHSVVDTLNQVVMLHGLKRSSRPPDKEHPLGHGRELYFWSFVVAVLIFAIGAGVSVYEGITHVMEPHPMENPWVNYVVLAIAGGIEFGSWLVAMREFRRHKGDLGYFEAAEKTKDPSTLTLLLEDSAALLGIAIALAGTAASQAFDLPVLDGVASILIGLLLGGVSLFLARESKQLLIGEPARRGLVEAIRRCAEAQEGVHHVNGMLTIHLAPRQVVCALSIEFDDALKVPRIETAVEEMEARIRHSHPEVTLVFVKPQRAGAYQAAQERRQHPPPE
jgi:cation diffusion facilitator family transporter